MYRVIVLLLLQRNLPPKFVYVAPSTRAAARKRLLHLVRPNGGNVDCKRDGTNGGFSSARWDASASRSHRTSRPDLEGWEKSIRCRW